MLADVVIVREEGAYRLLHGHLRLANLLREQPEVWIEMPGMEPVRVLRTARGYVVGQRNEFLPLLPANGFFTLP
jgi:hypothetical protein